MLKDKPFNVTFVKLGTNEDQNVPIFRDPRTQIWGPIDYINSHPWRNWSVLKNSTEGETPRNYTVELDSRTLHTNRNIMRDYLLKQTIECQQFMKARHFIFTNFDIFNYKCKKQEQCIYLWFFYLLLPHITGMWQPDNNLWGRPGSEINNTLHYEAAQHKNRGISLLGGWSGGCLPGGRTYFLIET